MREGIEMNAQLDEMRRNGLSIDGDNAYKRDLIDCIVGTLAFGKQGVNQPPAGHWAELFWDMSCAEGELQEQLLKERDALIAECERLKAENEQLRGRCEYCDGTGDVHGLDGEWRGECTECEAAKLHTLEKERDEARTAHQQELERHRKTFTQLEQAKRELEEAAAKRIYEAWADQPGYVPWVAWGNSLKQDEARRIARKEASNA